MLALLCLHAEKGSHRLPPSRVRPARSACPTHQSQAAARSRGQPSISTDRQSTLRNSTHVRQPKAVHTAFGSEPSMCQRLSHSRHSPERVCANPTRPPCITTSAPTTAMAWSYRCLGSSPAQRSSQVDVSFEYFHSSAGDNGLGNDWGVESSDATFCPRAPPKRKRKPLTATMA